MKPQERAERQVRRIESFSDLVIGFSLALLALTLSIPPHIQELLSNPWWLIAYFWTFAVITGIWFNHQRLFTHYFWPEPATVFLNFVLLSFIGLIVYFVQVFVHYTTEFDKTWALIAYFAVQALAFIAMGSLYWHGTYHRWNMLDPQERFQGVRSASRGIFNGVCVLVAVLYCASRHPHDINGIIPLTMIAVVGAVTVRLVMRIVEPRIVQGGVPADA